MDEQAAEALLQATDHLRAGQLQAARQVLAAFIKQNPQSDRAWYLLSFALEETSRQVECLQRAVQLNPANAQARGRLQRLGGSVPLSAPKAGSQLHRQESPGEPALSRRLSEQRPEVGQAADSVSVSHADDQIAELRGLAESASDRQPAGRRGAAPASQAGKKPVAGRSPQAASHSSSHSGTQRAGQKGKRSAAQKQIARQNAGRQNVGRQNVGRKNARRKSAKRKLPWGVLAQRALSWPLLSWPMFAWRALSLPTLAWRKPANLREFGEWMAETEQPGGLPVWLRYMLLGLSGTTLLVCLFGVFWGFGRIQEIHAEATQAAYEATRQLFPTFPPTWTLEPPRPATLTPTLLPTRLPSVTPTLAQPAAEVMSRMERIQGQVSELRGLELQQAISGFLTNRDKARRVLSGSILSADYQRQLKDQATVLSALGLVQPSYDLANFALNSAADGLGGFYLPGAGQIFVLGAQFSGVEQYIYTHEYDHALVQQNFALDAAATSPQCQGDSQRCSAIRALIEGDAALTSSLWIRKYASRQEAAQILNLRTPAQALPEQNPPAYVMQDLLFSGTYGTEFVQHLYNKGRWTAVNKAYTDLPESSEQILHPEKYDAHHHPILVEDPPLADILGDGWRKLSEDVLGEWMTYLILARGANLSAQRPEAAALAAAKGWGGDRYQVYRATQGSGVALEAHWVWDTARDASEFAQEFKAYLEARFHGAQTKVNLGECWHSYGQTNCLYSAGSQTLWLQAPDQQTIDQLLALFPDFQ